jgi:hypothetical protein
VIAYNPYEDWREESATLPIMAAKTTWLELWEMNNDDGDQSEEQGRGAQQQQQPSPPLRTNPVVPSPPPPPSYRWHSPIIIRLLCDARPYREERVYRHGGRSSSSSSSSGGGGTPLNNMMFVYKGRLVHPQENAFTLGMVEQDTVFALYLDVAGVAESSTTRAGRVEALAQCIRTF